MSLCVHPDTHTHIYKPFTNWFHVVNNARLKASSVGFIPSVKGILAPCPVIILWHRILESSENRATFLFISELIKYFIPLITTNDGLLT